MIVLRQQQSFVFMYLMYRLLRLNDILMVINYVIISQSKICDLMYP